MDYVLNCKPNATIPRLAKEPSTYACATRRNENPIGRDKYELQAVRRPLEAARSLPPTSFVDSTFEPTCPSQKVVMSVRVGLRYR